MCQSTAILLYLCTHFPQISLFQLVIFHISSPFWRDSERGVCAAATVTANNISQARKSASEKRTMPEEQPAYLFKLPEITPKQCCISHAAAGNCTTETWVVAALNIYETANKEVCISDSTVMDLSLCDWYYYIKIVS